MSDEHFTEAQWALIAAHLKNVAAKAFMRGWAEAETHYRHMPDYPARQAEAALYIASGFEVDTVKKYVPEP